MKYYRSVWLFGEARTKRAHHSGSRSYPSFHVVHMRRAGLQVNARAQTGDLWAGKGNTDLGTGEVWASPLLPVSVENLLPHFSNAPPRPPSMSTSLSWSWGLKKKCRWCPPRAGRCGQISKGCTVFSISYGLLRFPEVAVAQLINRGIDDEFKLRALRDVPGLLHFPSGIKFPFSLYNGVDMSPVVSRKKSFRRAVFLISLDPSFKTSGSLTA